MSYKSDTALKIVFKSIELEPYELPILIELSEKYEVEVEVLWENDDSVGVKLSTATDWKLFRFAMGFGQRLMRMGLTIGE